MWIFIDGVSLESTAHAELSIKDTLKDFICKYLPDNSIKSSLFKMAYPQICIIRLVKNYLLIPQILTYDTINLACKNEIKLPHELYTDMLPETTIRALRINTLSSLSAELAQDFIRSNIEFYAFLTHVADINTLENIPEESIGLNIIEKYMNDIIKEKKLYSKNY